MVGWGCNEQTHDFASQLVERRQGCEGFDAIRIQSRRSNRSTEDDELVVILGVGSRHLRSRDRIIADRNARRTFEEIGNAFNRRSFQSAHGQTVLRHAERSSGRAHARTKIAQLGDRQARVVGDNHGAGIRKDAIQVFNDFRLLGFIHFALLSTASRDDPRNSPVTLTSVPGFKSVLAMFPSQSGFFPCLHRNF